MNWTFDHHGINENGLRLATLSEDVRMTGRADTLGPLLSAAPEMLKALKKSLRTITDPDAGVIEAAKLEIILIKAIKKAEGIK